jgi:hypothetical protein
MQKGKVATMSQMEITVANYTLSLRFDDESSPSGTVVRNPDGVEASFNSPACLLHLLEGMLGRRAWQAHGEQILAALRALRCPCA